MSTFARGTAEERVLLSLPGGGELDEWSNAGGAWHSIAVHPVAELGLQYVSGETLSSDGLRVVLHGQSQFGITPALYSDRASIDAPFRAVDLLPGVPPREFDAVISDDCGEVYFSALGAEFLVRQK